MENQKKEQKVDLKHTSKEKILKMYNEQVKTNANLKNEISAQNTAIAQLRANSVKPGFVTIEGDKLENIADNLNRALTNDRGQFSKDLSDDRKHDLALDNVQIISGIIDSVKPIVQRYFVDKYAVAAAMRGEQKVEK